MSPLTADEAGVWLGDEQRALAAWNDHHAARNAASGVIRIDLRTA